MLTVVVTAPERVPADVPDLEVLEEPPPPVLLQRYKNTFATCPGCDANRVRRV